MSFFAICSFDLQNADADDYANAYKDLAGLGLQRKLRSSQGNVIMLPTTMVGGEFNTSSTGTLRDNLTASIKKAFEARRFKSEIFVLVGDDWAWGHRVT